MTAVADLDRDACPTAVDNTSSSLVTRRNAVAKNVTIALNSPGAGSPGCVRHTARHGHAMARPPPSAPWGELQMPSRCCRTWSAAVVCALLLLLGAVATTHAVPLTFAPGDPLLTGIGPSTTAAADLNGDGLADIVTANFFDDSLSVFLSNASAPGTFLPAVSYPVGSPVDVSIADLNLDGILDLVVISCSCQGPLTVFLGTSPPGTFLAHQPYALASEPYALAVADLNGDGLPDLAISSDFDEDVTILLGDINAPGTLLAGVSYPVGYQPGRVSVGDFNNDGVPDLAISVTISDSSIDGVAVLLGNVSAPGTFLSAVVYATGGLPDSVVVGDFNRDGLLDLAVGTVDGVGATVSVLLGNQSAPGTFAAWVDYAVGNSEYGLALGDIDGDGKLDLVAADGDSNRVRVLRGHGDGTFRAPVGFAGGALPVSPVIADLDGDGRPDIAVSNVITDRVSLRFNTTPFAPKIRFSRATYWAPRETVSPRIITVLRRAGLGVTVTVDYAASDGTATEGSDYVATAGTLTFGPMETSKTFELPIIADGITEGAETVNLTLSNPGGGAVLGDVPTAVLTIAANNTPFVQFSRSAYNTMERAHLRTITVTRRNGFGTSFTVDYATIPGGTAIEGQDYTATSGTLSFGPNDPSMTFQVPILDDPDTEGPKTINLELSNQSPGATIGPRSTAILTILAND
jgi:Calx-beta domain-containing protein/VCBS repeat protein